MSSSVVDSGQMAIEFSLNLLELFTHWQLDFIYAKIILLCLELAQYLIRQYSLSILFEGAEICLVWCLLLRKPLVLLFTHILWHLRYI